MIKVFAVSLLLLAAGCNRSPQARRDQYVSKGKAFLEKQSYSRALLEFKNAIQVAPQEAELYYQVGLAYNGLQEFNSAAMSYRKCLDLNPKHTMAQLRYSQLAAMSNDKEYIEDANRRLKAMLDQSGRNAEVLHTLAFTELKLGNVGNAEQTLEQILVQSPSAIGSAILLAQTKLSKGDLAGAEAVLKKASQDSPKNADLPRYLAELYIFQRKFAEADKQLHSAISLDPKDGAALLALSRLQLTTGQKNEAEQNFKRLSEFRGYEPVYAQFLYEEGRKDESVRELERLFKKDPADRSARTRLVAAYRAVNRVQDAKKVLADALAKNAHDSDALLQRGEIYLTEEQFTEAETDFNMVLKATPSSAEVHYLLAKLNQARGNLLTYRQELVSAMQLNPALLAVRVELAQSLIQNKDGRSALNVCDEAPELQRNAPALQVQRNWALWLLNDMPGMRKGIDQGLAQERNVDLLIQDGMWKLRSNNPAGARAALEEALKIDPADLRALQGLHQTYLAQKDTAGALQKVKEYASQQPKSAPVQDFLGLLLAANGKKGEARSAFATAKAADPHYVSADLSLVQLDASEGRTDEARQRLETVVKNDNSNLTALRWLGNLEAVRGNHDAAIEHFRKVVAADPNDAQASNNLAYLLVEYRNEHDMALKLAQKAVDLNPNAPEFCDTLGWVLYRKGVYNSAIPYFQKASASPENVVWKYHLAMAYAKAGDLQRGKAALDAAYRVNSKVPEAKLAKDLLEKSQ